MSSFLTYLNGTAKIRELTCVLGVDGPLSNAHIRQSYETLQCESFLTNFGVRHMTMQGISLPTMRHCNVRCPREGLPPT